MISSLFDGPKDIMSILVLTTAYIVVICFSFSAHEFAHAFTAYKFGDYTPKAKGRLSLNPVRHIDPIGALCLFLFGFGWAKPVEINPVSFRNYKLGMSLVSIAGVVTNLLLSFIFSGLYFFTFTWIESTNMFLRFLSYIFEYGTIINISLVVFNLLPIYPLDGFKFLQTFMSYGNKFVQFMYRYGSLLLLIFIITPIFDIMFSFVTTNILSGFFSFWGLFR